MTMPKSIALNCDCMEFLRGCSDNQFALAVVDPPYNLKPTSVRGAGKLRNRLLNQSNMDWDKMPPRRILRGAVPCQRESDYMGRQLLSAASVPLLRLLGQAAAVGKLLAGRVCMDFVRQAREDVPAYEPHQGEMARNAEARGAVRIPLSYFRQRGRHDSRHAPWQWQFAHCGLQDGFGLHGMRDKRGFLPEAGGRLQKRMPQ